MAFGLLHVIMVIVGICYLPSRFPRIFARLLQLVGMAGIGIHSSLRRRSKSVASESSAVTNPLNDDDLAEFVKFQKTFADSPKSWSVDASGIDQTTFDLSVKNPDGGEEVRVSTPSTWQTG